MKQARRVLLTVSGALWGLATAVPALAAKDDFPNCDGYGAPTPKSDGMTTAPLLFGLATTTADIRKDAVKPSASRVAYCDAALADPLLQPQFWLRRASLQQARAIHLIAAGKFDDALQAIAASDAAGAAQGDLQFADSLALGNRLVEALARAKKGDKAGAEAQLARAATARPYANTVQVIVDRLRHTADPEAHSLAQLTRSEAPTNPGALETLLYDSILRADFATVESLFDQIDLTPPANKGRWEVEGEDTQVYRDYQLAARFAGIGAYALAALGRKDEAAARIAPVRKDIAVKLADLPPRPDGKKHSKRTLGEHAEFAAAARGAAKELDAWEGAIRLRDSIAVMPVKDAMAAIDGLGDSAAPALCDLIGRVQPGLATDAAAFDPAKMSAECMSGFGEILAKRVSFSMDSFFEFLPRAETPRMKPTYKRGGDGYFLSDNGFSLRDEEGELPIMTVRFTHSLASGATVEELVMLATAATARRKGFDSFLLLDRRTLQRTTVIHGAYGGTTEEASGYEAQLRVLFTNAASVPARFAKSRWRLLDAEKIETALNAKYPLAN